MLTIDTLPSAFHTTTGAPATTPKYSPIPTAEVIRALLDEGWNIDRAFVGKSNRTPASQGNAPFRRHTAVLRHPDVGMNIDGDGGTLELLLRNSHDGASSYQLDLGIFRMICSNGLVLKSADLGTFRARHVSRSADIAAILAGSRDLAGRAPTVSARVTAMRNSYADDYAETSTQLVRKLTTIGLSARGAWRDGDWLPGAYIAPRRYADGGGSLWDALNIAQEHAIRGVTVVGGHDKYGEDRRIRPINPLGDLAVKVNRAVWNAAEGLLARNYTEVEGN